MKAELQTIVTQLGALIGQLPEDPPHRFRLTLPWPQSGISSPDGYDLINWSQAGPSLFPGATWYAGDNSLTLEGHVRPSGVGLMHQTQDTTTMEWSEQVLVVHEWADLGPVDASAELIASQAARITELEQMVAIEVATSTTLRAELAALNARIDAAQGQP